MTFSPIHPEQALLMVFAIDYEKLMTVEGITFTRSFMEHNECGLAYDDLVCAIEKNAYSPSPEALSLIKQAGQMMGIEYPNLSC
jgi:hypothetical protein